MAESVAAVMAITRVLAGNVFVAPASLVIETAAVTVVNGSTYNRFGVTVSSTKQKYPWPALGDSNRSNAPFNVNPSQSN